MERSAGFFVFYFIENKQMKHVFVLFCYSVATFHVDCILIKASTLGIEFLSCFGLHLSTSKEN